MATVASLAALVGGAVAGDGNHRVDGIAPLEFAGANQISFFTNTKYRAALANTAAGAIIMARETAATLNIPSGRNLLLCSDPYLAMAKIATALHPASFAEPGTAANAYIGDAAVHSTATVGPGAVIEDGADIGPRSVVSGGSYVGRGARIGAECLLHPGVRVLDRCVIGDRVILHANAVIGSDGFGYAPDDEGRRHKIPQLGIVVIEDDVEIGACSTVDRATFGETRIGRGTKIDNLVQIAHNVTLGEDCVVVSQSGIAGSTRVGNRVTMGAQTGMVGHIEVADDVVLGGRGAFGNDVSRPGIYSGAPAFEHRGWLRSSVLFKKLPDLFRRLRAIERQLSARQPNTGGSREEP